MTTEQELNDVQRSPNGGSGWAGHLPSLVFLLLVVFLGIGLTLNPRSVPSPLIGKLVPDFNLPPVEVRALGLVGADLRGQLSIVNAIASWCIPY